MLEPPIVILCRNLNPAARNILNFGDLDVQWMLEVLRLPAQSLASSSFVVYDSKDNLLERLDFRYRLTCAKYSTSTCYGQQKWGRVVFESWI